MSEPEPGTCVHCGRTLAPAAQFCGGCGVSVDAIALTAGPSGVDIPTMAISTPEFESMGELAPPDPYDPNHPDQWRPRRRALPWVAAVVAVALIAVAVAVASGSNDGAGEVSSKAKRDGPIAMPSVLVFKLPEAMAVLAKEGIDADQVTVRRVPRADVGPGTVLDQFPRPGMNVAGGVTLTASRAPDKVPNFVGKDVNAARATFSMLNVNLTVEDALDASVADGTVLSQQPPSGAPFAKAVHLTVARMPIPTNLGDFTGVGATPAKLDSVTIAATAYPDSLSWNVRVCPGSSPVTVSYLLAGRYRKLIATATLGPAGDPADRVHLDVTVDGEALVNRDLDRQSSVPIDIDLADRQQLALTFTPVDGGDPNCMDVHPILGWPQVLSTAQSR